MNEHLRDRILRRLEALSDDRGYQLLDYVEFLESKYAERQAPPGQSAFTRFAEAVEDQMRAGKMSAQTISETMGLMNRAMGILNGVAAAGRSMAEEIIGPTNGAPGAPGTGSASPGVGGAGTPPAPTSGATPPASSAVDGSADPRTQGGPST